MSTGEITENIVKQLTESLPEIMKVVIPSIIELIPNILKELMPTIIRTCKEEIKKHTNDNNTTPTAGPSNNKNIENDVIKYKRKYKDTFDELLKKRENAYYGYAKNEHTIDLYNDCMESNPIYIPKKFRQDDYNTMTDEEIPIIKNLALQRCKAEVDLCNIRRNKATEKVIATDKEADKIINGIPTCEEVKSKLKDRWTECITTDMNKVNKKWEQKIASHKVAFTEDKNKNPTKCLITITNDNTISTNQDNVPNLLDQPMVDDTDPLEDNIILVQDTQMDNIDENENAVETESTDEAVNTEEAESTDEVETIGENGEEASKNEVGQIHPSRHKAMLRQKSSTSQKQN